MEIKTYNFEIYIAIAFIMIFCLIIYGIIKKEQEEKKKEQEGEKKEQEGGKKHKKRNTGKYIFLFRVIEKKTVFL